MAEFGEQLRLHQGSETENGDRDARVAGFLSTGSLVDGVLNMGSPVPIDGRITGTDMTGDYDFAQKIAAQIRGIME